MLAGEGAAVLMLAGEGAARRAVGSGLVWQPWFRELGRSTHGTSQYGCSCRELSCNDDDDD